MDGGSNNYGRLRGKDILIVGWLTGFQVHPSQTMMAFYAIALIVNNLCFKDCLILVIIKGEQFTQVDLQILFTA